MDSTPPSQVPHISTAVTLAGGMEQPLHAINLQAPYIYEYPQWYLLFFLIRGQIHFPSGVDLVANEVGAQYSHAITPSIRLNSSDSRCRNGTAIACQDWVGIHTSTYTFLIRDQIL